VTSEGPRLYSELADWYHLLTAPHEYVAEAVAYRDLIEETAQQPVKTILELGCGGGANASHLKRHYEMTLTDISEPMLAQSRKINPELEHLVGDMRTLRLDRTFDAVMIHDAIDYMTTRSDLSAAIQTAAAHLESGGLALFIPDHIKDVFAEGTDHGGHDDDKGRGLRYVEWTWDPDPNDDTYIWDFAYMMRDETGDVQIMHDRHICGVFTKATWLDLLQQAGLQPTYRNLPHPEVPQGLHALVGIKP
jgi:trans-aconitate methyltransferase